MRSIRIIKRLLGSREGSWMVRGLSLSITIRSTEKYFKMNPIEKEQSNEFINMNRKGSSTSKYNKDKTE